MPAVTSHIDDIDVNHTTLHYKLISQNDDNPWLVFFPGGPGFGFDLYEQALLPFLSQVNLCLFDPRGCGDSPATGDITAYTLERTIEDAVCLIQALQKQQRISQKIILHGSSYGSMVALGFSIAHPLLVDQLILVTGAASYHFIELAKIELANRGNAQQQAICRDCLWPGQFDQASVAAYFKLLAPLYSTTTTDATSDDLSSFRCNVEILNQAFKTEFEQFDYTPLLHRITCPTLIMAGRQDWINPPALATEMHQGIAQSKLIIFEQCGHAITTDAVAGYEHALRDFLHT